ncbi:MAG: ATP-dependent DNA helicase [Candidatus Dehalobacter alkaniphilus]
MFDITTRDYSILEKYILAGRIKADSSYFFTLDGRYIVYFRFSGKRFTYSVLNYATEKSVVLAVSRIILSEADYPGLIKKILHCKVYQFVLPAQPQILIEAIFRQLLPEYGYTVRDKQIELSVMMFESMRHKKVALCEAEVGTGKTLAYLVAAIVYGLYEVKERRTSPYVFAGPMSPTPITITTSSIDLQQAIIGKFIPDLSRILMEYKIIQGPVTAVLRKGKEHYLCEERYADFMEYLENSDIFRDVRLYQKLKAKALEQGNIDLDAYTDIKQHVVRKINVPRDCDRNCPYYKKCRYIDHISRAKSDVYTFQVTNHNYYLANAQREHSGLSPLIPKCGVHIIDEAHKLLDAAYQILGQSFPNGLAGEFIRILHNHTNGNKAYHKKAYLLTDDLAFHNQTLFMELEKTLPHDETEESRQKTVKINAAVKKAMRDLQASLDEIYRVCFQDIFRCRQLAHLHHEISNGIETFIAPKEIIYWLEKGDDGLWQLTAIPINMEDRLEDMLWQSAASKILTSATLTDDTGYGFFKEQTGIGKLSPWLLAEIQTPSPFDYKNNTRIYLSDKVPYPDKNDERYITAVSDEIEKLVEATHGHTAILFTSYKLLSTVHELLKDRITRFPLITMHKGTKNTAEAFRKSRNGVLFASGSFWEGVDFPGDILSSIIVVNLPFPVPSPIMEYKKKDFPSLSRFIDGYAFPVMIARLRQGLGRLIRSETDTGVVAILDYRVSRWGKYRRRVRGSILGYTLAGSIDEVREFIKSVKDAAYFE